MVEKSEDKEATAFEPVIDKKQPKNKGWNVGRWFWGLLLVIVGGLILANNLGWLSVNWDNLWRLWPLVIVVAGLSVLSVRNKMWRIITFLLMILSLVAVVFIAVADFPGSQTVNTYSTTSQKLSSDITQADITLKAGAGTININSADQDPIVKAKLNSDSSTLNETSTRSDTTQNIVLSMDSIRHMMFFGGTNNTLDVSLTRNIPLILHMDIGAARTIADLSDVKLQGISVKSGATELNLTLGNKSNRTSVDIQSGVSSTIVRIPKDSGVNLTLHGSLSSNHLSDLVSTGGETFQSPGYESASNKIDIVASIGVASFTIERY